MIWSNVLTPPPRAAGILIRALDTGRVLLLRRSDDGFWGTPGGHIERGESPYGAMLRELEEETGRIVIDRHAVRPHAQLGSYVLFYGSVPREFTPELNEEHTAYRWAPLGDLPRPLHPGLRGVVRG